jgi:hypothetical protein
VFLAMVRLARGPILAIPLSASVACARLSLILATTTTNARMTPALDHGQVPLCATTTT